MKLWRSRSLSQMYIIARNAHPKPSRWRKRPVYGANWLETEGRQWNWLNDADGDYDKRMVQLHGLHCKYSTLLVFSSSCFSTNSTTLKDKKILSSGEESAGCTCEHCNLMVRTSSSLLRPVVSTYHS